MDKATVPRNRAADKCMIYETQSSEVAVISYKETEWNYLVDVSTSGIEADSLLTGNQLECEIAHILGLSSKQSSFPFGWKFNPYNCFLIFQRGLREC